MQDYSGANHIAGKGRDMGRYSVRVFWSFRVFGVGLFTEFKELGIAAAVLGPLHIHVTWPVRGGAW